MRKVLRNGDWHFVPVKEKLTGKAQKHKGSYIFAVGEATNHNHVIEVPNVEDMKIYKLADGSYMVDLRAEAKVTHPEHSLKKDLYVAPGRYKLVQRREKDWFQLVTRRVID